ncbi:MAG: hypothetical protein IJY57_05020 [Clostridia bacterium]|nr:hypothetical protein [Clostridia bacterium]
MKLHGFNKVSLKVNKHLLNFKNDQAFESGCKVEEDKLFSGIGLIELENSLNNLAPIEYFSCAKNEYVYCADNNIYSITKSGYERVGMLNFKGKPKFVELSFYGKPNPYALYDGSLYPLTDIGAEIGIIKCDNCQTEKGYFFCEKGYELYFAPAIDIYEKGYDAINVNCAIFDINDGKVLGVYKVNDELKIITENRAYSLNLTNDLSRAEIKCEKFFCERVSGAITVNGALYLIGKTQILEYSNSDKGGVPLPFEIESVLSLGKYQNNLVVHLLSNGKEKIIVLSKDKSIKVICVDGLIHNGNGKFICKQNNMFYELGLAKNCYYESKKIPLKLDKEKCHLIAVSFNSKTKGVFSVFGDFGSKEYNINAGENYIKLNAFSKHFTFKFYLESGAEITEFSAQYTE